MRCQTREQKIAQVDFFHLHKTPKKDIHFTTAEQDETKKEILRSKVTRMKIYDFERKSRSTARSLPRASQLLSKNSDHLGDYSLRFSYGVRNSSLKTRKADLMKSQEQKVSKFGQVARPLELEPPKHIQNYVKLILSNSIKSKKSRHSSTFSQRNSQSKTEEELLAENGERSNVKL